MIVEVRQFDQYVVRVDGSGRVTLRNRKFLRKYTPVISREPLAMLPGPTVPPLQPPTNQQSDNNTSGTPHQIPKSVITPARPLMTPTIHNPPDAITTNPPVDVHSSPPPATTTPDRVYSPPVTPPSVTPVTPPSVPPVTLPSVPPPIASEVTKTKRIPLSLKNLQSYNTPGLQEHTLLTSPTRRVTRQSTKK